MYVAVYVASWIVNDMMRAMIADVKKNAKKTPFCTLCIYRSLAARKSFCNYKYVPLQMVNDNDDISSLWIWLDRRRRSSSRIIQDLPHLVGWFGFDAFILIVSSRDLWLVGWMDGIPKNCPYILAFRIIHLVWNSYASPPFLQLFLRRSKSMILVCTSTCVSNFSFLHGFHDDGKDVDGATNYSA